MIKLDYSLETPEERKELVEQILAEIEDPSPKYLEVLADYLILCMEKQERKKKKIITENRLATITKRETSFEGLVSQFENGEDGVYNLMTKNKNIIFQPRVTITKQDIEEIPELKQLRQAITSWETALIKATGKDAFIIKKALIEMRKDQYVIKTAFKQPISFNKITRSRTYVKLDDKVTLTKDNFCVPSGVSCIDSRICQTALCNYNKIRQSARENYESDLWFFLYDFTNIMRTALKDYPVYWRIVQCKINELSNEEIQTILQKEFGILHTAEYISCLWRNKIPKIIASAAEDEYLDWYFMNIKPGQWKRCSKCGEYKLAHNKYFSKNKTSKDGWYSLCKICRNIKK